MQQICKKYKEICEKYVFYMLLNAQNMHKKCLYIDFNMQNKQWPWSLPLSLAGWYQESTWNFMPVDHMIPSSQMGNWL